MANYKMELEEEETLFQPYPYPLYFVQSPSTISNTNNCDLTFHSPIQSENYKNATGTLSRYSSSRGSNNSFKKKTTTELGNSKNGGEIVDINAVDHVVALRDQDEASDNNREDDEVYNNREWWTYFSFKTYSNSMLWILVQLIWRVMLSLAIALIVFYIVAKPPSPTVSIKIAAIRQFRLGEGVDASGVATKLLSCNCSIHVTIDNKSKLFDLHIYPPSITMLFGHLPFATSQGVELYAGNDDVTLFKLSVGTKNKPMYGAGRSMQDLLESGKRLPLIIKVNLKSSFQVILGFFEPNYHHKAQCMLLLDDTYDKKLKTQIYTSKCIITL